LYNIIDAPFKQCKTSARRNLRTINNIVECQILIDNIDRLGAA